MRRLPLRPRNLLLVAAALFFCLPALAQVPLDNDTVADSPDQINIVGRAPVYSLRGSVRDTADRKPLSNVRVFLRALTGESIGPTYTNDSGNYAFQAVPGGYYTVECDLVGYESTTEEVDVADGSAFAVDIALRKIGDANAPKAGSGDTVSAHDLSVPTKARDSMEKATRLLAKSDFSGAAKEFQRAIDAYPNYYEAYAKMGLAYIYLNDEKKAEPALRKSIELSHQKDVEAYTYLAQLLSREKKYGDAEESARKAVALDSKSWQTNLELAIALYGNAQDTEAETYALASVKLGPDHPDTYLLLTNIQYSLGNYRGTLGDMDTYLRLAPNGPAAEQMRNARTKVQKELADEQTVTTPALTPVQQPAAAPARDPNAPTLVR